MTIKLKGSTDGSVSLTAPADTDPSGSDIEFTLPTTLGSVNQFVKNTNTLGELDFSNMVETSTGVGIGTTSPTTKLDVTSTVGDTIMFALGLSVGAKGTTSTVRQLNFYAPGPDSSRVAKIAVEQTAAPLAIEINNSERMRIASDGALYVGYTSGGNVTGNAAGVVKAKGYNCKQGLSNNLGNNTFNIFWTGSAPQLWIDNTNVGTISVSSDYRVKDNVTPILDGSIDRIKQLRPVQYQYTDYENLFTADGVTREGFIAHEVAEVIPSGAEGEKDDPNQIQSLKLDAILSVTVKALQEAVAKIEALETKVAALEAGS